MSENRVATKVSLPTDKHHWHPSPLPGQVVLVTTRDAEGRPCVAPKSWVSMVAFGPPPVLMFGCSLGHGTAKNVQRSGQFVVNVPGHELAARSFALGSDDGTPAHERLARHGLTLLPGEAVAAQRIAECRAHLECELLRMEAFDQEVAIFGRIVAASIDTDLLEGEPWRRYAHLAPFFFLENGLAAPLGAAATPLKTRAAAHHALTILAVRHLLQASLFYRTVFGWLPRVDEPVYVELALPDGRGLGLYERGGFAHNTGLPPHETPDGAISPLELYLYVNDLPSITARLEQAGARLLSAASRRGWGDTVAYYADLDGHVLAIATSSPDHHPSALATGFTP